MNIAYIAEGIKAVKKQKNIFLEKFIQKIEGGGMVYAPRRSGKSTAILLAMHKNNYGPNRVIVCCSEDCAENLKFLNNHIVENWEKFRIYCQDQDSYLPSYPSSSVKEQIFGPSFTTDRKEMDFCRKMSKKIIFDDIDQNPFLKSHYHRCMSTMGGPINFHCATASIDQIF